MRQYETTFIVAPALPDGEIKKAVKNYKDILEKEGCEIVHVDEIGLRQLTYPIKRHNSGIYFTIEYKSENGEIIDKMELVFRRDERILRFLSVRLDKFGVKYNEDKRSGVIDKRKNDLAAERAKERAEQEASNKEKRATNRKSQKKKSAERAKAKEDAALAKAEVTDAKAGTAKTIEVPADVAKTVEVPADVAKTVEVPADVAKATAEPVVETVDTAVDVAEEVSLDGDILGDLTDSDKKG